MSLPLPPYMGCYSIFNEPTFFDLLICSGSFFLVTSLKMLQSDWLLTFKDIVIMTLRCAKTIFLDTWYAKNVESTHIYYERYQC